MMLAAAKVEHHAIQKDEARVVHENAQCLRIATAEQIGHGGCKVGRQHQRQRDADLAEGPVEHKRRGHDAKREARVVAAAWITAQIHHRRDHHRRQQRQHDGIHAAPALPPRAIQRQQQRHARGRAGQPQHEELPLPLRIGHPVEEPAQRHQHHHKPRAHACIAQVELLLLLRKTALV